MTEHPMTEAPPLASEQITRITRDQYPEIIQAARWMDEDNGTPHFEPGAGFIVDDPDSLTVPNRWLPHLDRIEAALAALDHSAPHPLDVDMIEWLAREGKEPTIFESAVRCFVSGEHTPMTAMAHSSSDLFAASVFFNERFEGWEFDPTAGFAALSASPAPSGQGVLGEVERSEAQTDAWNDFVNEHLTDGNGYAAADVWKRCQEAFDAAWPSGWELANKAAFAALSAPAPSCAPGEVERVARAICQARYPSPDTLYQHNFEGDWPEDDRREYADPLTGEPRVMLFHRAWRRWEKAAAAAIAALSPQGLDAKEGE